MKARIGWLVGVVLFSCSSGTIENDATADDKGWDIVIKGKVGFPQQGVITLREARRDGGGKVDSIVLKSDYTFEKKVHLTEPGNYHLNFYGRQILSIILNKSNIEVNVDGNNPQGFAQVIGSAEQDLVSKVQSMMGEVQADSALKNLEAAFNNAAQAKNEIKMNEIRKQYMTIFKTGTDKVAAFLLQQPASIAVMDLLMQFSLLDPEQYFNVYADAAAKLKAAYPTGSFSTGFVDQVEKMKAVSVGSVAPEIALPNPEGVTVKLSSLRGKYVLVDFWAKWCGPCRRENPNVVKAYRRFKDKGFEVFGVSLDRTKEDWVQAIQQDGLVWTHVSDLKYFDCQAARDYSINAIPFSILLDKKGVIIAKNLRGAALEEKLEEVLGK